MPAPTPMPPFNPISGTAAYGDISRDTAPQAQAQNLTRVLMQQGRVLLDADWNEQVAILWQYLRALATTLIGPHGGTGFLVKEITKTKKFTVAAGAYFVDGLLCENNPKDLQNPDPYSIAEQLKSGEYVIYLDVWERQVYDDYFREKALGGADTAARVQVVWQVKILPVTADLAQALKTVLESNAEIQNLQKIIRDITMPGRKIDLQALAAWVLSSAKLTIVQQSLLGDEANFLAVFQQQFDRVNAPRLAAQLKPDALSQDPCILSPTSAYRGQENQLYRVEIQTRTTFKGDGKTVDHQATFKWSRDNGAVMFPIRTLNGTSATLAHLGRDASRTLRPKDWVEVVDDNFLLSDKAGVLAQVETVDSQTMRVTLKVPEGALPTYKEDATNHPMLRRWDHADNEAIDLDQGAIPITSKGEAIWIDLENGIQVQFDATGDYHPGDYWLIPARTATGRIEWPLAGDEKGELPHGVAHHYAPLAQIFVKDDEEAREIGIIADLRRIIQPIAQ